MLAKAASRVGSAVYEAFWTVFYFFYFLFNVNPEWKCERHSSEIPKTCCVEVKKIPEQSFKKPEPLRPNPPPNSNATRAYPRRSYWSNLKEWAWRAWDTVKLYGRRVGRFCYVVLCKVARVLRTILVYLWAFVKAFFSTSIKSKSLPPSAPKPFRATQPESPSFNKVEFNPEELVNALKQEDPALVAPTPAPEPKKPKIHGHPTPAERAAAYANEQIRSAPVALPRQLQNSEAPQDAAGHATYGKQFTDTSLDSREGEMSSNIDVSTAQRTTRTRVAPPAPPPVPPTRPLRIDTGVHGREDPDRWDNEGNHNGNGNKKEPQGIGKLPAEVMAELHERCLGTQKMRLEREASVQRDMTQSCHPDMQQWKQHEAESRYDRSATATPFRASSVGPTMRRLEQVVSRLEDSSDNEPQYIFRAKPSDYMMGKSVFTPVEEAERMRDTINRNSRPVTPAHSVISGRMTPYTQDGYSTHSYRGEEDSSRRRARTVGPIGRESMPRTSGFYATSPVTSHTVRRTPLPFDRGSNFAYDRDNVTQGIVSSHVRRWPPASNATGAEVNKDDWMRELVKEQDDGLITTMCRRVVERKTEDNWKWRDERGQLLDEKSQRTWKGELDTVLRDGPGEARHWSRTVELLPTGDTRFQDVSRQYNKDYVVESIVRNY